MLTEAAQSEWLLQQKQYDSYEKCSLGIKLISIIITAAFFAFDQAGFLSQAILLILWFQDGIWKTYQARIEGRILSLEQDTEPFQFHTQFQENRPSTGSLIKEYARNAFKPTTAFPYIVLMILVFMSDFVF
ncbi:hypothetical protein ACFSJY_18555 [Thalassotalea euphylliae]|uniref:hypothetical protein n=1 Tax=Thalassotalea euphylliae TaxID=1655234 RepID=UPI00363DF999